MSENIKDPESLKVTELKQLLKKAGLNASGLKKDLVERLKEYQRQTISTYEGHTDIEGNEEAGGEEAGDEGGDSEEVEVEPLQEQSKAEHEGTQPVQVESLQEDPLQAEPSQVGPPQTEPAQAQHSQEKSQVENDEAEHSQVEHDEAEHSQTEHSQAEHLQTESLQAQTDTSLVDSLQPELDLVKQEQAAQELTQSVSSTHIDRSDTTVTSQPKEPENLLENPHEPNPSTKRSLEESMDSTTQSSQSSTQPPLKRSLSDGPSEHQNENNLPTNTSINSHDISSIINDPSSLHPVTTALCIQNLSRPLVLSEFRQYVDDIADEDSTLFWLDNLRTHCFIKYTSPQAANKVRLKLNGNKYPPTEKMRGDLLVDYVPEAKVQSWIDEESKEKRSLRRWKIKYSGPKNNVVVIHEEESRTNQSMKNVKQERGEQRFRDRQSDRFKDVKYTKARPSLAFSLALGTRRR